MESQHIYSDDSSYHSSQDSDYAYDSQDDYSGSNDGYVNWIMKFITLMTRRISVQNIPDIGMMAIY